MTDYWEASHQQQKELLLYLLRSVHRPFNLQQTSILFDLDRELFEAVLQKLVERHESLRSTLHYVDGTVRQRIHGEAKPSVRYLDYREERAFYPRYQSLVQQERNQRFDLENGPLFSSTVVRKSDADYVFIFTIHHAIADAWSLQTLSNEFRLFYEAFERGNYAFALPPLRAQNKEYAHQQTQELTGPRGEAHRRYWLNELQGKLPAANLTSRFGLAHPAGGREAGAQTYREQLGREMAQSGAGRGVEPAHAYGIVDTLQVFAGASFFFSVDFSTHRELLALATKAGASVFTLLLATFHLLSYRLTGQPVSVIGCPIATRWRQEFEAVVGWLMGAIISRVEIDGQLPLPEFIARVHAKFVEANEHRVYPYERILADLDVPLPALVPLFINYIHDNTQTITDHGLTYEAEGDPDFDLEFAILECANGLKFNCTYKTAVFGKEQVETIIREYLDLLKEMVSRPEKEVSALRETSRSHC
jgi:hypothetical protein